jgi:hypothetical protein
MNLVKFIHLYLPFVNTDVSAALSIREIVNSELFGNGRCIRYRRDV